MKNKLGSIKIGVRGYGGTGISFFKIVSKKEKFVPESIINIQGKVENPTYMLKDNLHWCYLGERDSIMGFIWDDYRKVEHSIEVKISQEPKYL